MGRGGYWTVRLIILFLAYLLSLVLLAAAYAVPAAPSTAAPASPDDLAFAQFIKDFRPTALAAGITPETYDAALGKASRLQRVADLNLNQPEFVTPVWSYLDTAVSTQRVSDGRALMIGDAAILAPIVAKYGVPPEILISIWGTNPITATPWAISTCSRRWRPWPMTVRAPTMPGRNCWRR